jgi:hypothetical protein
MCVEPAFWSTEDACWPVAWQYSRVSLPTRFLQIVIGCVVLGGGIVSAVGGLRGETAAALTNPVIAGGVAGLGLGLLLAGLALRDDR